MAADPLPNIAERCCSAASIWRDQEQEASGAVPDHFADALGAGLGLRLQHGLCPLLFLGGNGEGDTHDTIQAWQTLLKSSFSSKVLRPAASPGGGGGLAGGQGQRHNLCWMAAGTLPALIGRRRLGCGEIGRAHV